MTSPLLLLSVFVAEDARADGSDQLGLQKFVDLTQLHVDVLAQGEEISWEGSVLDSVGTSVPISMELFDPAGASLGVFPSGSSVPVLNPGAYLVDVLSIDTDGDGVNERVDTWDLSVVGAAPGFGRAWAVRWFLSSEDSGFGFTELGSFDGSFFTMVSGGSTFDSAVVELKAQGLVGRVWQVTANALGILGYPGRSTSIFDGETVASQQIYLLPPEAATYTTITPELANAFFDPGACEGVAPALSTGAITFDSTVEGSLHFVCDIDQDGFFDFTDDDDVHILVDAVIGLNEVEWDGTYDSGQIVPPGTYTCQVILTVGEFHYVANDVESSYPGFRVFSLDQGLNRTGLEMFWNDTLVQAADVLMPPPTSAFGLMNTGLNGIESGDYADLVVPNVNARSWGNFTATSKGNDALLDTYTWLADDRALFNITVLDTLTDADSDGIVDSVEDCVSFTDPTNPDSDGDGLEDGLEYYDLESNPNDEDSDGDSLLDGEENPGGAETDSDSDGILDLNDPDDDGDSVLTIDEVDQGDTDGDGDDDYLDPDDDDDGTLTIDEAPNGDTDGDGDADYLDIDDDGDGIDSQDELGEGDFDGDGLDDRVDPDDDNDGIPTLDEGTDDADGDGDGNWHDTDSDDDGLLDAIEGTDDGDGDGAGNFVDTDSDDDTIPDAAEGADDPDADGAGNFVDTDSDDDSLLDSDEAAAGDSDSDGADDYVDPDDDGDAIPTIDEGTDDPDGDGTGNWLDEDSDDDTVPDATEGGVDSDGDGSADFVDTDDDDDTIPTAEEPDADSDADGLSDRVDDDDDDDGLLTADEKADGELFTDVDGSDFDGDGLPNWLDLDSDGDGVDDAEEGRDDTDGDGSPQYLDVSEDIFGWYQGGTGCDHAAAQPWWAGALLPLLLVRRNRGRKLD
jgi:hypothetical protein